MPVAAGADGCKAGWIAAFGDSGDQPKIAIFRRLADLVGMLPADAVIAVDMPIGLPDRCGPGGRGPESLVRPLIGMRQSSVFSIPSRAAVYATGASPIPEREENGSAWLAAHRHASAVARDTSTPPRGVSIQAFGLFAKIRELDALLRERAGLAQRVLESHPELCFWRLNGHQPLVQPKKVKGRVYEPGMAERRALLAGAGIENAVLYATPPAGAGEDDLLDALALMTAARNRLNGTGLSFPDPPLRDTHGLPIAISC
jgi:predicted RNase H-like nuclease